MNFFRSLSVRARLVLAFGVLFVLLVVNGAVGLRSLHIVEANGEAIYNDRIVPLDQLKRIADAYAVDVIDAVNKANAGRMSAEDAVKALTTAKTVVQRTWTDYMATVLTPEEAQLARQAQGLFGPANAAIDRAAQLLKGKTGKVPGLLNDIDGPLYDDIDPIGGKIAELVELQLRVAKSDTAVGVAVYQQARALSLGMMGVALAVAVVSGLLITRSLMGALGAEPPELSEAARRVAAGDLRPTPGLEQAPKGSVLASLGDMQRSLASIVGQVRGGSDGVATASAQIAQGNLDLSSRTEEQASALEQTAATMEQLSGTVRNNADNAREASHLAQAAAGVATQGGEVVGQVVNTMRGISDSSRRIGDIIGVIDGISFQTNLLALNAAVEAARAGEQGRGFAVVASEVRILAQRSAEAAKEIKGLITRSVEQVEQGTVLVDRAGKTMDDIVGSIKRVSDIVGEISSATSEQSSGIQQVGDAVSQMDQVTQQNAALVEESAAAAQSLKTQAQQLVQAVSVFKLAGDSGVTAALPAPAVVRQADKQGSAAHRPVAAPRPKAPAPQPHKAMGPVPAGASAKAESEEWAAF